MSAQLPQSQSNSFNFPDIPWQPYPVYSISKSGRKYNFKSIIYPNSRSAKKYTRKKQLTKRSMQAKIFDAIINIGYFDPLVVTREFPILVDHNRTTLDGGYLLLDYFIPNLRDNKFWGLDIELDSEYHSQEKDMLRDEYLQDVLGVKVFRISHLEKSEVQKKQFKELTNLMRTMERSDSPRVFTFTSL